MDRPTCRCTGATGTESASQIPQIDTPDGNGSSASRSLPNQMVALAGLSHRILSLLRIATADRQAGTLTTKLTISLTGGLALMASHLPGESVFHMSATADLATSCPLSTRVRPSHVAIASCANLYVCCCSKPRQSINARSGDEFG